MKRVELFLYLIEAMESIALAAVAILIGSNRKSNDRYEKILRNMDMEQHQKKLKIFAKSVERSSSLMYILKIFVAKSVDQLIGLSIHFVVIVTTRQKSENIYDVNGKTWFCCEECQKKINGIMPEN